MTSNQLKNYELFIRQKELAEQRRANLAKEAENIRSNTAREAENIRSNQAQESLKNRESLAKYGSYNYATSDYNMSNTSWGPLKVGLDTLGIVLDPIYRIFGGKK